MRIRWYRHECLSCGTKLLNMRKTIMCCGADCVTEIETRDERVNRYNEAVAYRTDPKSETYWSS